MPSPVVRFQASLRNASFQLPAASMAANKTAAWYDAFAAQWLKVPVLSFVYAPPTQLPTWMDP